MIKNETIHVCVNGSVKSKAENTLNALGISLSEAVNMLLHQISLVGGIPFELKIPSAPESVAVRSREELYESVLEAKQQIADGKGINFDDAMARLGEKYGFSS